MKMKEEKMSQGNEFISRIRSDFPLIKNHPEIAYLDNAATSQKPLAVLLREKTFYEEENANPLRGLYALSVAATDAYENAREAARRFIGAESTEEIVFTRNASESLNLVAYSASEILLQEGDEILITIMEHHSNLLPWQQAAKRKGAVLRFIECDMDGGITEESFRSAMSPRTKIVAMTQISNVLGVRNDIRKFSDIAHEYGAVFVCDGAQSVPHIPVNVRDLDVDFLAFSGHKMLGPMGIGVLYGKKKFLEEMPPFLFGGEMIEYVTRESATFAEVPEKFEAGTVNASGAVGLGAAIRYLKRVGFDTVQETEKKLTRRLMEGLAGIPEVTVYGSKDPEKHCGIVTFNIEGCHPHDVASVLDTEHICIRAGHHCAQPLMQFLGVNATARASLYFYNTEEEVDRFVAAVGKVRGWLGY